VCGRLGGTRGTVGAGDYNFFYGKGNRIINWELVFFVHRRIVSAVNGVEFVSNRVSCIILRGRWCHIVPNVHSLSEEKSDDSTDSFYEELEQVFNPAPVP
jgi:hypothetical protein